MKETYLVSCVVVDMSDGTRGTIEADARGGTNGCCATLGMREATHNLVPHVPCVWSSTQSSAIIQQPASSHEPIARTSSTTKWGVARREGLIQVISRITPCDTGGADIIVHGGMHGLTLERGVS